jgi:tRNA nucleotidyltransferase (CCA-adding enzyme)
MSTVRPRSISLSPLPDSKRLRVGAESFEPTVNAQIMDNTKTYQKRTLELTPTESSLRDLLLDVAKYVEQTDGLSSDDQVEVDVPERLSKQRTVLRFTGGWVRDKLLGIGSHDIDVAINNMTGYQFGLKMKEYLEIPGNPEKYGLVASSKDHGLHRIEANPEKSKHLETVTTKILGIDLDIVNLRKETYTEESRNPQMEFGTAEEDALRRDATVNAMFFNLNTSEIEDFTQRGFKDMELKIIRTPLEPYQTFIDDPLRVLRVIRFATRLGYSMDPDAEQAMKNPDIRNALKVKISRERIGTELEKMLKGPNPYGALGYIDRLGLYTTIFTDPAKEHEYSPELEYFRPSYSTLNTILAESAQAGLDLSQQQLLEALRGHLIHDSTEEYLAWNLAALVPFGDAHVDIGKGKTRYIAELTAREGFKATNKMCDVISHSCQNLRDILTFKNDFRSVMQNPNKKTDTFDPTRRDSLGMSIRKWGPTWRSQILYALLYEASSNPDSKESKYCLCFRWFHPPLI